MTLKRFTWTRIAASSLAIGALALAGCSAPGQQGAAAPTGDGADACAAFEGKTVELVIPYSPGGGYDTLARTVLPGLENALGAKVVPINKPGAGGLLAINELSKATPDGSQIAIVNGTGAASAILAEAEGPTFDFDGLSYVGRIAIDDPVVATATSGDFKTWDDVLASDGFTFGSTGRGSSDYILAQTLIEVFDLKNAEVVTGFGGQSETELALIQANVDAIAGPLDSRRASIESGESHAVLAFADEAPAESPDAATLSELDLTDEQTAILDGIKLITEFGRPLVAPPGMDEGTLGCLQDALAAAVEDPEVVEMAEKAKLGIDFLSGEDMKDEVVPTLQELPQSVIDILKASY
ncbi:hypothetical protein ASD19_00300 [Microbacterium sp. Root53]|uniref:Bug family tripartite tricarboxylate transporter substrate binding protein n=1 Tax=Microbacterium sp. Root53 TaxID=1736553 RepID=UPI0006FEF320|nr:tripartite tricarboxylate transporter substrate-binding protein [Microbacterium sp. Root53]KQZ11763.1 hypothetical protein ASD19_00300 [Microbacterium sp. Root53]